MDEFLVLRRLNIEIQGFRESYTSMDPIGDNVGAEPHPLPLHHLPQQQHLQQHPQQQHLQQQHLQQHPQQQHLQQHPQHHPEQPPSMIRRTMERPPHPFHPSMHQPLLSLQQQQIHSPPQARQSPPQDIVNFNNEPSQQHQSTTKATLATQTDDSN